MAGCVFRAQFGLGGSHSEPPSFGHEKGPDDCFNRGVVNRCAVARLG